MLDWFHGKTASWLEERLREYADHESYKMALSDVHNLRDREEIRRKYLKAGANELEARRRMLKQAWEAAGLKR